MTKTKSNILSKIHSFVYLITHSFLVSIIFIMILFGALVLLYVGDLFFHINRDDYTSPLFSAYVIVSPSMVPTISVNDAIVIKRVDHDQYDVGDIITFVAKDGYYNGLTITHRVVDKENVSLEDSLYTTKGDNNRSVDSTKVETKSIYGKVLFTIPKVGYVKNFFSSPSNFFITFMIPIIFIIIYEIGRIFYMLNTKEDFL